MDVLETTLHAKRRA